MPYKYRRRFRRRRRFNRSSGFSGAYRTVAKYTNWDTVWKAINNIKDMVNAEKKMYDVTASSSPDTSGNVQALTSSLSAGNDVNNRSGNSILANALLVRLAMSPNSGASSQLRCVIFQDLQNTGSAPAVTDVLQSATVTSPLNVDTTVRWRILRDKIYTLNLNGYSTQNHKHYIRIKNHIKYTGTGANPYTNQIYMILLSDQGAGTAPTLTYYSRLYFYDN